MRPISRCAAKALPMTRCRKRSGRNILYGKPDHLRAVLGVVSGVCPGGLLVLEPDVLLAAGTQQLAPFFTHSRCGDSLYSGTRCSRVCALCAGHLYSAVEYYGRSAGARAAGIVVVAGGSVSGVAGAGAAAGDCPLASAGNGDRKTNTGGVKQQKTTT